MSISGAGKENLQAATGHDAAAHPLDRTDRGPRKASGHLNRLVDDLLDVSRIARGRVELKRQTLEITEVAARAIEMSSPLLEQRSHRLHVDVPRGLHVDGDPTRLGQVISNLLTNAARYTPPDGDIWVQATQADGWNCTGDGLRAKRRQRKGERIHRPSAGRRTVRVLRPLPFAAASQAGIDRATVKLLARPVRRCGICSAASRRSVTSKNRPEFDRIPAMR